MLPPEQLLGRLSDEADVIATLAELDLVTNLIDESTTVQALANGIELALRVPWKVALPAYAGLETKPKKRPYKRAVIADVTMYNEGTLVQAYSGVPRKIPAGRFAGELPRALAWDATPATLVERHGPPKYSSTDPTTQAFTWLR